MCGLVLNITYISKGDHFYAASYNIDQAALVSTTDTDAGHYSMMELKHVAYVIALLLIYLWEILVAFPREASYDRVVPGSLLINS